VQTALIDIALTSFETIQELAPGGTIFAEGSPSVGVYVLQAGEVALLFSTNNGQSKPLRTATAGQILGLSEVMMQRPYDCSATAKTPCKVRFIGREEFLHILVDRPDVWLNVLRLLSRDVNAAYADVRALAAW
jgi:CRP-like cAMP-binding protein